VSENSQGLKGVLEELQERKEDETDKEKCTKGMASDPGSWDKALRRSCGNGLLGLIAREVGQMHEEVCWPHRSVFGSKG
jgi:hypothetical protein